MYLVFQHLSNRLKAQCNSPRTIQISVNCHLGKLMNHVFILWLRQVSAIRYLF